VVALALVRVGQHRVGLVDLPDPLLGLGVVAAHVRVVLAGQPPPGALDLVLAGVPGDAHQPVVGPPPLPPFPPTRRPRRGPRPGRRPWPGGSPSGSGRGRRWSRWRRRPGRRRGPAHRPPAPRACSPTRSPP